MAKALVLLATCVGAHTSDGISFGPNKCIQLSKSMAGSCVISTKCGGADISLTEFVFDCVKQDGIMRHSFGTGGFDANEEFDSEVKCDKCAIAPPSHTTKPHQASMIAHKSVAASLANPSTFTEFHPLQHILPVRRTQWLPHYIPGSVGLRAKQSSNTGFWPFDKEKPQKIKKKKDFDPPPMSNGLPGVTQYGPKKCVSTYKNLLGECVMETQCKGVDTSEYEYGLICIDKAGEPVKHTFGKDTFDEEEKFDTHIKCHRCVGLEDIPAEPAASPAAAPPAAAGPAAGPATGPAAAPAAAKPAPTISPKQIKKHHVHGPLQPWSNHRKPGKGALSSIGQLSKEIEELTGSLSTMSANVNKLNGAVFRKKLAAAKAAAAAKAGGAPAAAKPAAPAAVAKKGFMQIP